MVLKRRHFETYISSKIRIWEKEEISQTDRVKRVLQRVMEERNTSCINKTREG